MTNPVKIARDAILGLFVLGAVASCKKDGVEPTKQKENVSANAINLQLRTDASGQLRGIGSQYVDSKGNTKNVIVDIGPDANLKNGTTAIANNDIVADGSQLIASGVSATAAIKNPTNPNTITFDTDAARITLNVNPETTYYLNGRDMYTTMTLKQVDSVSKIVAGQTSGLYSQIRVQ